MRDPLRHLQWSRDSLWILDQRALPGAIKWIRARDAETVARAIETLAVRGAPAIGVAAAYGVALASRERGATRRSVNGAIKRLARTRPTGFNLFSALAQMRAAVEQAHDLPTSTLDAALLIHANDELDCELMAAAGLTLFKRRERVLTYCNTGALATGGIGTALGVIKTAYAAKRVSEVVACETRPVGQGARLTVWECARAGIPVTLICDNMAAALMSQGQVDRVLVGADRIARNGDTSNKIGTLSIALLAHAHQIPFHVVAPHSTFDFSLRSGTAITIEERDSGEVTGITPGLDRVRGYRVWNPAFDVTPGRLVTSFVTAEGIWSPPFTRRSRFNATEGADRG
ncbi:S-methyl-5-thioribose-1-phosphate isomerase [candidate division KSB1 bacterium]|nr:S-methyl-5-thioribose-1-phosphate isomerase [candidate division KSB1 bacterium]